MENKEKLREYTLGSDGFHYVCEHDIANEPGPEQSVIYMHQIENEFHPGEQTECTEELLAWIEKENEVYELHESFSLEKKRRILFSAFAIDDELHKKLIAENRISDCYQKALDEMSEEDVDSLMSYLRFTRALCSAICIYDDVWYEEEMSSASVEIAAEDVQNVSEKRKPKYDPEWARHAAEDLVERLSLFDVFAAEPTESAREEWADLMRLAEDIAYSLVLPEAESGELADGRVRFESAQEMLDYLLSGRDLYNQETGEYVWLYNEAGSIAVDKLSKEDILRISGEKESVESWSGYIPGGADIWDDVSYDGYKVPKGCTNLDYCESHYAENWVDCKEYEMLLLKKD